MSQAPRVALTTPEPGASAGQPDARWLRRRLFPILATVGLIVFGVASTTWWGPGMLGNPGWSLPNDLWATLAAAQRLLHGNLGGLYTPPTRLITFPGAAVILVPVVAIADAAGERLGADRAKRAVLALASAVALWSVSVRWGHPEDAVAVGLLLYAILALSRSGTVRA